MLKRLALVLALIATVLLLDCSFKRTPDKSVERKWAVADSKAYAKDIIQAWSDNQYLCLEKLWSKESNWRAEAYNKVKVMGKNAGGIPQMLGMSTDTPEPLQIDRGFKYIMYRYGTPCQAWKFHQRRGWY